MLGVLVWEYAAMVPGGIAVGQRRVVGSLFSAGLLAVTGLGALCPVAGAAAPCPTGAGTGSASYATPGEYSSSPPTGVQAVCVVAVGAFGGNYQHLSGDVPFFGGSGATVSSWLSVPSQFYVEVGSAGGSATSTTAGPAGVPYGGGGQLGSAGGGGESALRTMPLSAGGSAGSRMLVAGGGGGAGGEGTEGGDGGGVVGGNGGNAYLATAVNGYASYAASGSNGANSPVHGVGGGHGGGGAGFQPFGPGGLGGLSNGGAAATDGNDGGNGGDPSSGVGGPGAPAVFGTGGYFGSGGGGGGGYAGGGGGGGGAVGAFNGLFSVGAGAGGGGGSSFVDQTLLVGGDFPTFATTFDTGVSVSWIQPRTISYTPHTTLSFSAQTDGVPSAPLQVIVTNTAGPAETVGSATVGGEPLHLSGLAIVGADGGDYQITAPSCASIPAQGSCTIEVTFTPTATGDRPATLQFSSDDRTQAAPDSVALDGNGIARTSSTTVRCPPGTTTVGATLTCTLTVSDTDIAPASTPTGSVAL